MHLFPIISLLFVVTTLALIHIPKSFCQDPQFLACAKAYQCGNINFTYPFWGGNGQNIGCGYPGFQVSCQANVPRITIGPVTYRVLSPVDATTGTLTVARDDLWNNTCPRFLQNSTMDFNIFSYSSTTRNLTLFYGCPLPTGGLNLTNQFYCSVNGTTSSSFFTTSSNTSNSASPACSISITGNQVTARNSTNTATFNQASCSGSVTTISNSNTNNSLITVCSSSIYVPVNQVAAQNLENTAALRAALAAGFTLHYQANNTICNRCRESGGRCGYNNGFICYCAHGARDQVCGFNSRLRSKRFSIRLVGILVLGGIISLAGIIIYLLGKRYSWWEASTCWKSDKGFNGLIEEFMRNYGSIAPKLYTYAEIKRMTNSFAVRLGRGGYGYVYRGKLSDGRQVAVKVLNDNKGNGEDFINEVAAMSRTSHVNVLTLLGFCCTRDKRALIFEFMPNGSLDKFICKMGSSQDLTKSHLEWKLLFEIAVGIARGLEYLHRGCNARIVHFDIKPQNILLDADFCPKISDFGLAKLCKTKESILSTSGARGTVGYIAPEVFCRNFGGMSHKSDVYSYGMMVLEMIGLRRKHDIDSQQNSESENYFPNWIYVHVERGKSLPLEDVRNEEEEETARKMILVGLWCIQTNPAHRPSISKVVEMLEGSLQSIQMPPKPVLDSHMAIDFNQEPWSSSSISEMAILNDRS